MHPILALFEPDNEIERRERQARGGIHRPKNGDPTHWLITTTADSSIVSRDHQPNRSPFASRKPSRKCDYVVGFPNHGVLLLVIPAFCTKSDYLVTAREVLQGRQVTQKTFFLLI
jgi:hypothetical protein